MVVKCIGPGLILNTLATLSPATDQPNLLDRVRAYQEAKNRQDLDTLAAMLADDARFEMAGIGTLVGKGQIGALDEYDVGINTRLALANGTQQGNTVTCQVVETNDWLDAAGLSENHYTAAVFTFENGLIAKITATLSPRSAQLTDQVLEAFVPWIAQHHPESIPRLFTPQNQFIYSRETGVLVVRLLKEWRASTPTARPTTGEPNSAMTPVL